MRSSQLIQNIKQETAAKKKAQEESKLKANREEKERQYNRLKNELGY